MSTDWTRGGKRKRHRREQQTKTYYNGKHNSHAAGDSVHEQNLEPNTHMSSEDILALKIHGLYNGNDSFSSDSGLSTFDEEYYKYKPQPIQIDINQIIVIRSKKNTNAKHKTYRDATVSRQRNYKSSNANTPSVGKIKVDNKTNKDEGEPGVTKQSNLINEKGSIFTISDGRNKTIPDVLAKNLVDQRRPINEVKPKTLADEASQGPNDIKPIPKPIGVFPNQDVNYARLPLPRGKVVMPDVAKTHSLSSIPSIESRQPKNDAQTHKLFANDFENDIEDLDTAASTYPHIKSGQSQKIFAETLKNHPGTQERNKTTINSRQMAPKVHQQLKPDMNPVQDCSQLPPIKSRQPSPSKNEASLNKPLATFGQTQLKNSDIKSISNDTLKKPPVTQKIAPKIIRQFDDRMQVSTNDPWVDQSHNRTHVVKNIENIPPIRRVSQQNFTEKNTFTSSTQIPQGNNILRHIPDQTNVIVRQPQVLPIQQTTQRFSSTVGENAEHEDDINLLGETSEGYFARLRLCCCCSRT